MGCHFVKITQRVVKLILLGLSSLLSLGLAQDTYHCPDGWFLEEDRSGCRCFLFSESEMVTRDDADVLCAYHDGSWVAELDHPGINYWLKSQLLDITDVGQYEQFWLEPDPRNVTAKVTLENGSGTTRMKLSIGLIGLMVSPTINKDNIVWS